MNQKTAYSPSFGTSTLNKKRQPATEVASGASVNSGSDAGAARIVGLDAGAGRIVGSDAGAGRIVGGADSRAGRIVGRGWPGVPQVWLVGTLAVTLAAFAAAVALAPPASAPPARGLTWLLFVGSSVHVASTGWLYTLPEVRGYARQRPARLVLVPAALIAAGAAAAALVSPAALTWCLLPYYGWQFFHFQKQNLGLAALAASWLRTGPLRPAERRAIMTAGGAGIAGLVAHPGLLQ